jgi:O-antigen/teichoic acid export membrane protein
MLVFFGITLPGSVGATLLTSAGKQQKTVWVGLLQIGLMVLLFFTLWPRYRLLGVTLAYGISLAVTGILVLAVAKWTVPVKFSALRDYALFITVCILAGGAAIRLAPVWMFAALPAWMATMGLYLVLARYRLAECRDLLRCFVPGRLSRVFSS